MRRRERQRDHDGEDKHPMWRCEACHGGENGRHGMQWAWRSFCRVCGAVRPARGALEADYGLGRPACIALEDGCLHDAESAMSTPRGPPDLQSPAAQPPATQPVEQPPAAPLPAAQPPAAEQPAAQPSATHPPAVFPPAAQRPATPPPAAQPPAAQQAGARPPAAGQAFTVQVVWGTDCANAPVRMVPRSALRPQSAPPAPAPPSGGGTPTEEKPLGVRSSTGEA